MPCALVGDAALIDCRGCVVFSVVGGGFKRTKQTTPGSATVGINVGLVRRLQGFYITPQGSRSC